MAFFCLFRLIILAEMQEKMPRRSASAKHIRAPVPESRKICVLFGQGAWPFYLCHESLGMLLLLCSHCASSQFRPRAAPLYLVRLQAVPIQIWDAATGHIIHTTGETTFGGSHVPSELYLWNRPIIVHDWDGLTCGVLIGVLHLAYKHRQRREYCRAGGRQLVLIEVSEAPSSACRAVVPARPA